MLLTGRKIGDIIDIYKADPPNGGYSGLNLQMQPLGALLSEAD